MSDNHEYVAITHLMTSRQLVNESARVRIVNVSIHTLNVHHTFDLKIYCIRSRSSQGHYHEDVVVTPKELQL